MHYTAPEILLMISAIGAVAVNIIVALRSSGKIDTIKKKTEAIEGHVNGDRTRLLNQLTGNEYEIARLKSVIAEKEKAETAVMIAQNLNNPNK